MKTLCYCSSTSRGQYCYWSKNLKGAFKFNESYKTYMRKLYIYDVKLLKKTFVISIFVISSVIVKIAIKRIVGSLWAVNQHALRFYLRLEKTRPDLVQSVLMSKLNYKFQQLHNSYNGYLQWSQSLSCHSNNPTQQHFVLKLSESGFRGIQSSYDS